LTAGIWLVAGITLYYSYSKGREDERSAAEIVYEEKLPTKSDFRILVPLAHPDHIKDLIGIAASVANSRNGDILALGIVKIPGQLPVAEGRRYIDEHKTIMDKAIQFGKEKNVVVHTLIRIGYNVSKSITDTIKERDIDMMIMGWKGFSNTRGSVFGGVLDNLVMNAECDVVMVKMIDLEKMKTILIPTSGGPHANQALLLVPDIAKAYGSKVTVCSVIPPNLSSDKKEFYQEQINRAVEPLRKQLKKKVDGKLIESKSISAGIIKESESFDACLIGAAHEGLMQQILFGSIPERIAKKCRCTMIMVKKHQKPFKNIISRLFKKPSQRVGKR